MRHARLPAARVRVAWLQANVMASGADVAVADVVVAAAAVRETRTATAWQAAVTLPLKTVSTAVQRRASSMNSARPDRATAQVRATVRDTACMNMRLRKAKVHTAATKVVVNRRAARKDDTKLVSEAANHAVRAARTSAREANRTANRGNHAASPASVSHEARMSGRRARHQQVRQHPRRTSSRRLDRKAPARVGPTSSGRRARLTAAPPAAAKIKSGQ